MGYTNNMSEEILDIVNHIGEVIGRAPRSVVHGNPLLAHRVVHVLVLDGTRGRILLQKRSMLKDVAPGRWDTSVGGHMNPGEELIEAALREMEEELGVVCEPEFLYSYTHSNRYETELVSTYACVHEGEFTFNRDEIDEVRFWDIDEIQAAIDTDVLSDNFKHEFQTYLAHTER